MSKSDLLKEAIADAKAIRETALANAKMRMEEAFTPKLQSMISARLQNEIEGEDEDEMIDSPEMEPEVEVEPEVEEEPEAEIPVEEPVEAPVEEPVEAPVEAPVSAEPETEVEPEFEDEVEEEGYDSLDLESIIRELDMESDSDETIEEPVFDDVEEETPIEEDNTVPMKKDTDVTSNIGGGDTGPNAGGGQQVSPDRGQPFSPEKGGELTPDPLLKQNPKNAIYEEEDESEEEVNLDEILKELEEAEMSDTISAESNPFKAANAELSERVSKLNKELKEHRNVIKFLKSKLNEVNLLNAKLLFTSKLFKSNNMSNGQKMKVIESFDRAKTLREVKLVYSTIAESINNTSTVIKSVKKDSKKITESRSGGASKPVASTKPEKKIIKESIVDEESANRLRKLAGITKK